MNTRSTPNRSRTAWGWYLLLLVPFVAILWVPFYASSEPAAFGIPYFYWYQFLWILISAILTAIVYFVTRGRESGGPMAEPSHIEDYR